MASREEVLASMRAPTPQDLDMKKVLQALAGAAAQGSPNTSWSYGMRLSDAQREGALAGEHQKELSGQTRQAMGTALEQDNQLFNRAMQAHNSALQERQMAISAANQAAHLQLSREDMAHRHAMAERQMSLNEEISKLERNYKQAQIDRNAAEIGRLNAQRDKLLQQAEGERAKLATGALGTPQTKQMQKYNTDKQTFLDLGFSDADAGIIASVTPAKISASLGKHMASAEKGAVDQFGRKTYGTKLVDGKQVQKTAEEWLPEQIMQGLALAAPGLSADGIKKMYGIMTKPTPTEAPVPAMETPLTQNQGVPNLPGGVTPEQYAILLQAFANNYKQ